MLTGQSRLRSAHESRHPRLEEGGGCYAGAIPILAKTTAVANSMLRTPKEEAATHAGLQNKGQLGFPRKLQNRLAEHLGTSSGGTSKKSLRVLRHSRIA